MLETLYVRTIFRYMLMPGCSSNPHSTGRIILADWHLNTYASFRSHP